MYQVIKKNVVLSTFENKAEAFAFAKEAEDSIVVAARLAVEDVSVQFAEDCQARLQNTFNQLLDWLKVTYVGRKVSIHRVPGYEKEETKDLSVLEFEITGVSLHLYDEDDAEENIIDAGEHIDIRLWWSIDADGEEVGNSIISLKDLKFVECLN
jgi:hypothetical protein